jgi:N-acetylneuraminic acid mutarotase
MKKLLALLIPAVCAAILLAGDASKIPPMPAAVSSNAVASLKGGLELFSMMGVGPRKSWDDITNQVYVMHLSSGKWSDGRSVPGVAGRLGASAAGVRGQVFLFGGYVVDAQGNEMTIPDVNGYAPERQRWYRAADIPVAVDRAVIGVNRDRYVYLVGGRSKSGPVNNVQVYDAEKDSWSQATPMPGIPVFGHAGGLVDDTIVYIDGAMKNPAGGAPYVASEECWLGKIDRKNADKIEWTKLPPHPGRARFGIAGGVAERERKFYFSGGTVAPHNFKGLGYDGNPPEISTVTFAFSLHNKQWETITEDTYDPRMDGSGVLDTPLGLVVLGGMAKNQAVTARVTFVPKKR